MVCKKPEKNVVQGGSAHQNSFSKRRTGVFKKVSELCTLCAVETALVLFSPGGKDFSFGHPCFEAIMKKLADPGNPDNGYAEHMAEHEAMLCHLNKQYSGMIQQLISEEKRGEEIMQKFKTQGIPLLDKPIEELNLTELLTLHTFLEQAKADLLKQIEERSVQNSDPSASSSGSSTQATDSSVTDPKVIDTDIHGPCHGVSNGD